MERKAIRKESFQIIEEEGSKKIAEAKILLHPRLCYNLSDQQESYVHSSQLSQNDILFDRNDKDILQSKPQK
jgi:hypothetical protein